MSLVRKITRFAASPQGRRAIDQARTRLDTPENRRRVTDLLGRRGTGGGAGGTATPRPPKG